MGGPVDRLQGPDGDLGVNLGRREFGVAEHRLDVAEIGAAFQHDRREGVPEQMTRPLFRDPAGLDVVPHELRQAVQEE